MKILGEQTSADRAIAFVNKPCVQWLLRLLFSVLLLGLLFRSIEPSVFWRTIRSVDITLLLLSTSLFLPGQLLAAYRWYFLLKRINRFIPFWSLLRYTLLGQLSAVFLPGRIGGEVVRVMAVTHRQGDKTAIVLSAIVDKMALLIAMISFALLGVLGSEPISQLFLVYWTALGLLILSSLIMFFLCRYRSHYVPQRLVRFSDSLPFLGLYAQGLLRLSNVPRLSGCTILVVFALAFILQLSYAVGSYLAARSMHIIINPIDWAAISALVALAQILPVSIGGLGIREGLFAGILLLYQVPVTQSTAFSLLGFVIVTFLLLTSWFILELVSIHGARRIQRCGE